MWVLLKQNYCGPAGLFVAGHKMDMPEDKVAKIRASIGKENVVDTCPPWEEHVDKKAVARSKFLAKVQKAISRAETLIAEWNTVAKLIETNQDRLKILQRDRDNAVKEVRKLAKAAGINWPEKNSGKNDSKSE